MEEIPTSESLFNRMLSTFTNISLIKNPSSVLIGTVDDDFYALNLSSCLLDDLIANIPMNNTIWLNFDSLSVRSKEVTEW